MRFHTTLLQSGKTATGLQIPPEVVEEIGSGKRPAVRVTLRGHTYRSTIAPMGGVYMLPVSAEIRGITGVAGGDQVDVELEQDVPGFQAAGVTHLREHVSLLVASFDGVRSFVEDVVRRPEVSG
jgi:hypothetical protein